MINEFGKGATVEKEGLQSLQKGFKQIQINAEKQDKEKSNPLDEALLKILKTLLKSQAKTYKGYTPSFVSSLHPSTTLRQLELKMLKL